LAFISYFSKNQRTNGKSNTPNAHTDLDISIIREQIFENFILALSNLTIILPNTFKGSPDYKEIVFAEFTTNSPFNLIFLFENSRIMIYFQSLSDWFPLNQAVENDHP
jgi:hypothetical protein